MSSASQIPAGWYPDPAGERQWRVWNGSDWTHVTRPYGPPESREDGALTAEQLPALRALARLTRVGVLAYYVGFALLVSLIAHWPGGVEPVSTRFASATLGAAIGLTLIGSVSFSACVAALRGRWTIEAVLPVVSSFAATYWMSRRLGLARPGRRLVADALVTAGFVLLCARQPWVGLALASVAFSQLARALALVDRLSGPPTAS